MNARNAEVEEAFIGALRAELEEYGGLLSLLNLQQRAVIARQADAVLEQISQIESQIKMTNARREQRKAMAARMTDDMGLDRKTAFRTLLPYFYPPLQPLVQALVTEVNRLVAYTHRRAVQNQALLARSVDLSQRVLAQFEPQSVCRTYSAHGQIKMKPAANSARLAQLG